MLLSISAFTPLDSLVHIKVHLVKPQKNDNLHSVFMFGEQEMGGICEHVHKWQNWYHPQKPEETISNQRRFLKLFLIYI